MTNTPDIVLIAILFIAVSFLPMVALVATSYLKIVVVLGLVRNAMGVQQVPPNLVLSAIALALTAFIMAPVATTATQRIASDKAFTERRVTPETFARLVDAIQQPLAGFLLKHTPPQDREFFTSAAKEMWADQAVEPPAANSLLILVPAFTVRELTRAFQIGFILYMAFIAVDLIVANIVQAFGLSMVSPTPIAIPFKLLLFIAFDGWQRLIFALVLSYK
jgi:type III secretion protein R